MNKKLPHAHCAHCGRRLERFEAEVGCVTLGSGEAPRMYWVCHPDDPKLIDCYQLVTVYNELLGARREHKH